MDGIAFEYFEEWCKDMESKAYYAIDSEMERLKYQAVQEAEYDNIPAIVTKVKELAELRSNISINASHVYEKHFRFVDDFIYYLNCALE